ncbi:MAG TPA: hypothetical protein PK447_00425 [Ignavibacteria bacterium]|nr:hypothetical protein [Ignavibacteria bacterium]
MKTYLYTAIFILLFSAAAHTQQDTSYKNLKIKGTEVEIGKFYRIILTNGLFYDAKLKGITGKEILVIKDNEAMEYNIAEIEKVIPLKFFDIPENSSGYNVSKRNSSPQIYFSLGYAKRTDDAGRESFMPSEPYEGFSVHTGMIFKISKYLGNIYDLSFLHMNGTTSDTYLGTPGQNYYYRWVNNYGDANDVLLKSGLALGYLDNDSRFNAYAAFGIILGCEIKGDDISNEYVYENNKNYMFNSYTSGAAEFRFGAFCSLRLSYRITKNLSVFIESSLNAAEKKTGFYQNHTAGIGYQL